MSTKARSAKKRRKKVEDLDEEDFKKLDADGLEKVCFSQISLLTKRSQRRSSQCRSSRKSCDTSDKENDKSSKKSRKTERHEKNNEKSEKSVKSGDEECRCHCCTRVSPVEKNTRKIAEDKMADIAEALDGERSTAIAAPLVDRANSAFVDDWRRIVRDGLTDREVDDLAVKYKTSEDSLKELRAPELNLEARSLVDATTLKIDEYYAARQNQSAIQLTVIDRVLGLIVEGAKRSTEVARLVENLHDFGRNNADIHHAISIARRRAIFAALGIDDDDDEIQREVGEKLFSRTMEMLLYKRKVRTEVEETVKPIVVSLKEVFEVIAANLKKDFFEGLKEVAADLKKELAHPQSALVVPMEVEQEPEQDLEETRAPEVRAKVEGGRSAKVEGTRSAKEEAAFGAAVTSFVPSERETYPGGAEIAKRSAEQRGVLNRYAKLARSTWKLFEGHIKEWWLYCQREQKDVAEPSAIDVLRFYESQLSLNRSLDHCRRALAYIIPERVIWDPIIRRFFLEVKKEAI